MRKRKPETEKTQRRRDLTVLTDVDPDDPLEGYKPDNLDDLKGLFQYLRRKEERILGDVARVVLYVELHVPHLKKDLTSDLRFIKRSWESLYLYAQGKIQAWMVRNTFAHEVYTLTLDEQTRLYDEEVEVADLPPDPGGKRPDVFYIDCCKTLGSPFRRAQLICPLGRFRTVDEQINWYYDIYGPPVETDNSKSIDETKNPFEPEEYTGSVKVRSNIRKNSRVTYGCFKRAFLKVAHKYYGRPVRIEFDDEEEDEE